jgi:MFS transporter, SP family, xylose:H+ symportor
MPPEIFKNVGFDTNASLFQTIIVGAVNLIFTVVAIVTVDKLGRKPLQIIGALVMAVAMIRPGRRFRAPDQGCDRAALHVALHRRICRVLGAGGLGALERNLPQPDSRQGHGRGGGAQWIANFLVSWTFPILNENPYLVNAFHHGFAYWIYGVMSILAALFMWKWFRKPRAAPSSR